jgi:hypothetical protein
MSRASSSEIMAFVGKEEVMVDIFRRVLKKLEEDYLERSISNEPSASILQEIKVRHDRM